MAEATTCAACGRAVWAEHVDAAGRCVLCAPVAALDPPLVLADVPLRRGGGAVPEADAQALEQSV